MLEKENIEELKETYEREENRTVFKVNGEIGRINPKNPAIIYDNGIVEYWKEGYFVKVGFAK